MTRLADTQVGEMTPDPCAALPRSGRVERNPSLDAFEAEPGACGRTPGPLLGEAMTKMKWDRVHSEDTSRRERGGGAHVDAINGKKKQDPTENQRRRALHGLTEQEAAWLREYFARRAEK